MQFSINTWTAAFFPLVALKINSNVLFIQVHKNYAKISTVCSAGSQKSWASEAQDFTAPWKREGHFQDVSKREWNMRAAPIPCWDIREAGYFPTSASPAWGFYAQHTDSVQISEEHPASPAHNLES